MDLEAVRTAVAVADAGRFQDAADELGITQQAASKRVAALERELGVRLFARTPRGARPTVDGLAFLPQARALLRAAERAAESVRPGRRPLRVDVLARRSAPAMLLRAFHRAHPDVELDVVALVDIDAAVAAVRDGTVDASFRAVEAPGRPLPEGVVAEHVLDEPLELLTGPGHALAGAAEVAPGRLAGHRIWIPGAEPGTEWAAYYAAFGAEFGVGIDTGGPNFGSDALLDALAAAPGTATTWGAQTRLVHPLADRLRRIPIRGPLPVYPHSLVCRADNPHPGLAALRGYAEEARVERPEAEVWAPGWAQRPGGRRSVRRVRGGGSRGAGGAPGGGRPAAGPRRG